MPPTQSRDVEFDNRDAVARTDQVLQDAAERESALRNTVKGLKMRITVAEEAVRTAKLATAPTPVSPTPVSPETGTRRRSIKSSDVGTGTNGPILSDAPTTMMSVPSVPRTQTRGVGTQTRGVGTSTGPRRTPTLSTYTEQSSYQHTEPYFRFADAAADAERRGANAQSAIQDANASIARSASVSREAQIQLRAAQVALDNVKSELRETQEAASHQISLLEQDVQNKDYALIDQISATQRAQESVEREKLATERQKKATQLVMKQRRKDSALHARHASSLGKRLDEKTKRATFFQQFYKPDPAQRRAWDMDISHRGYSRKVHFGAGQPGPGSN